MSDLPKIDEAITPTAESVAANLRAFAKDAEYLDPGSDEMIADSANLRYVQPNYQPFIHGTKNKPADPLIVLSKSPPGLTSKRQLEKTSKMIKAIVFNRDGAVDRFDGKKTILELITEVADDLISENPAKNDGKSCDKICDTRNISTPEWIEDLPREKNKELYRIFDYYIKQKDKTPSVKFNLSDAIRHLFSEEDKSAIRQRYYRQRPKISNSSNCKDSKQREV